MLSHLTSANDKERLLSMNVISYLAKQREFPPELVQVMVGVAKADPAAEVSSSAIETLAAIAYTDSGSASAVQAQHALQTLPTVLRIHIADETQREAAKKVVEQAKAEGFVVPTIENVGRQYSPHQTQLRFFHAEDKDGANKLAQQLSTTTSPTVKDFSKDVMHAPSRSLELWMARPKKGE
jgi:hypothetical protein